jgi:small subunit ribosomal protein S18
MTTENTETTSTETAAPAAVQPAAPAESAAQPAGATQAPTEPTTQPAAAPAGAAHRPFRPDARPGGGSRQGAPYRDSRSGPRGGGRRGRGRFYSRRRVCSFCVDHVTTIDYKDVSPMRRYVSDIFKIEGRRKTGTCAKHQRALATAIKRARHLALIPFSRTGALGQRFPG